MDCATWLGRWYNLAQLLGRLSLGGYFLMAGVNKITADGSIAAFVKGPFASMTPRWAPAWLTAPYGYALPILEVVFGATLAIGLFGRVSANVIALLLVSIVIAQFQAGQLLHNPPAVPGPYHTNVILLALALLMGAGGPGCASVDALWRRKK